MVPETVDVLAQPFILQVIALNIHIHVKLKVETIQHADVFTRFARSACCSRSRLGRSCGVNTTDLDVSPELNEASILSNPRTHRPRESMRSLPFEKNSNREVRALFTLRLAVPAQPTLDSPPANRLGPKTAAARDLTRIEVASATSPGANRFHARFALHGRAGIWRRFEAAARCGIRVGGAGATRGTIASAWDSRERDSVSVRKLAHEMTRRDVVLRCAAAFTGGNALRGVGHGHGTARDCVVCAAACVGNRRGMRTRGGPSLEGIKIRDGSLGRRASSDGGVAALLQKSSQTAADQPTSDGFPRFKKKGKLFSAMTPSIDATYGVWLVSLVLETILYGAGMLQVWMYFSASPTDPASIKWTVSIVAVLETVQVIFFSVSSYSRFVKLFGKPQTNLVWADSLQLLCAYLSAFVVQLFFANRIIKLTKGRGKLSLKAFGIYVILALALIEILAGITQVAWTYQIRSYLKLDQTKAVTTIQSAASLACDVLITTYLCLFLKNQKGEMMKTNNMVDALVYDAINRGTLTAMSSFVTMVLFLVLPDTFWFFLGLAPSSKLYMNSMLATLNTRQRIRNKIDAGDKGWNSIGNSIPLSTLQIGNKNASGQSQSIPSIAAVDLDTGSVDMCRKREEYPASAV
ncbi:hypothetical protein C8R43DRAFT_1232691 [Mycena crocata]|nr:hypothetical protein C8R43DRAFT_1232691 [Mycena crocata]